MDTNPYRKPEKRKDMTKIEFDTKLYRNMLEEMMFLYGRGHIVEQENKGKKWWTLPEFITHGKLTKKQVLSHVYSKRSFDLSELSYK